MSDRRIRVRSLLRDPRFTKGASFTEAERDLLGLRGLLPPRVLTQAEQVPRILEHFHLKPNALEQYIYLHSLMDRDEHLFFHVVIEHIAEMMPIIYTPTVGEACQKFGHLFRQPRGLYVTARDRGHVASILSNWTEPEVGIIVVTDGERILGLGDLGANGMGIPIGKLSLYTACAGVDPALCLPITIDVGCNRPEVRDDPLYLGLQRERARGAEYEGLLDEFVAAVKKVFPRAVLQFEDFATENAFRLLHRYRDQLCCFNDDIQGTAAVTVAGLMSAARVTGRPLADQTVLFLGAGSAATGIADLIVAALVEGGMPEREARRRCWFVDSKGLVVADRKDLAPHKRPYGHDHQPAADLAAAVEQLRPTALVGVSAQPSTFTEPVVRAMAAINQRPIVFPLSNPTSRSECTAEEAYRWSDGRAVFMSGSPFAPVSVGGRILEPGQGNNAYIFPGLGLGLIVSRASRATDGMFLAAARTLVDLGTSDLRERGLLFPPLTEIRRVSAAIAMAVAEVAYREGVARAERPDDLAALVRANMYTGAYPSYV